MCFQGNIKLIGVRVTAGRGPFNMFSRAKHVFLATSSRIPTTFTITFTAKISTPFQTSDVENWKMETPKKYLKARGVLFSGYNKVELV